MKDRIETKIESKFSLLVLEIQKAFEEEDIDPEDVRLFLIRMLANNFVQPSSSIKDIFTAMSTEKLWTYQHYSPLEEVTETFLPNSESVQCLIDEYKGRYCGFCIATKLIDCVKDTADDEDDEGETFSARNYTKHYKKIKAVLKVERKISDISLGYVNNLWTALAKDFELPSLTAMIDKIVAGSIEITWLVLPHLAETIILKSKFPRAVKFFRQHQIIHLMVEEDVIYNENQMVCTRFCDFRIQIQFVVHYSQIDYESQLMMLCKQGCHDLSKISALLDEGVDVNITDVKVRLKLMIA